MRYKSKAFPLLGRSGIEEAAQGGDGVTIRGGVQVELDDEV